MGISPGWLGPGEQFQVRCQRAVLGGVIHLQRNYGVWILKEAPQQNSFTNYRISTEIYLNKKRIYWLQGAVMAGSKCSKDVTHPQRWLLSIPQLWFPPCWLPLQAGLLSMVAIMMARSPWITFHQRSILSSNENLGLLSIGLTRLTYHLGTELVSLTCSLLTRGGVVSPAHTTWTNTLGSAHKKTGTFFLRWM